MARSNEPFWWALFSAGGVVAALFLPILIIVTGIALPLGWIDESVFAYERMHGLVAHPISKLFLFVVIALPFFHVAHRLRAVLIDVGLKPLRPVLSFLFYGGSIAGTIATAVILLRF